MNIDLGKAFSFGVENFKRNPVFYIGGTLILFLISLVIGSVSFVIILGLNFIHEFLVQNLPDTLRQFSAFIWSIICFGISTLLGVVIAPFLTGFVKGLKVEYEGGTAEITHVFSALNLFFPSILNYAVASLLIWVASCCCYFPAIIVMPLAFLIHYHMVNGETSGLSPFFKSISTLSSHPIIILYTLLMWLFASLGILLCCIGIVLTAPIAAAVMYSICAQANQSNLDPEKRNDVNAQVAV